MINTISLLLRDLINHYLLNKLKMNFETLTYLIPVLGVVGLLYTFVKSSWVSKQDVGTYTILPYCKPL